MRDFPVIGGGIAVIARRDKSLAAFRNCVFGAREPLGGQLSGAFVEAGVGAGLVGEAECSDFYEGMRMFDSDRVHIWRHESGIRIVLTPDVLKEVRTLLKQVVSDSQLASVFAALDARYRRLRELSGEGT